MPGGRGRESRGKRKHSSAGSGTWPKRYPYLVTLLYPGYDTASDTVSPSPWPRPSLETSTRLHSLQPPLHRGWHGTYLAGVRCCWGRERGRLRATVVGGTILEIYGAVSVVRGGCGQGALVGVEEGCLVCGCLMWCGGHFSQAQGRIGRVGWLSRERTRGGGAKTTKKPSVGCCEPSGHPQAVCCPKPQGRERGRGGGSADRPAQD